MPQKYRPPRQTPTQASLFAHIASEAAINSSKAKAWVLEYMGSTSARKYLDQSLKMLSNEDLFDRFVWEWEHLPIIHNAPVSDKDKYPFGNVPLQDDTILNLTLHNGYVQNVCQRFAVGADPPQTLSSADGYANTFIHDFGMPASAYPTPGTSAWTARQANECLLYDANNLQKKQSGNGLVYGGTTYVLNRATMRKRQFFEAWDAGSTSMVRCDSPHCGLPKSECLDIPLPGFGTQDDWLHLVQPHELLMNSPFPAAFGPSVSGCCNYNISDLFNRWWVDGAPIPSNGMMRANPYYETMVIGTVWVPEDILYIEVSYAGGSEKSLRNTALWGTPVGRELRSFMKKNRRPVVWSNGADSQMLIDPISNVEGGRITSADQKLFEDNWSKQLPWSIFSSLVPNHLKLSYLSYNNKHLCEEMEKDAINMIMGVDGNNNCVYWTADPPPMRWELLIDGTCEPSNSDRAAFASKSECQAAGFECITVISNGTKNGYCQPSTVSGPFRTINDCESNCRNHIIVV